MFNSFRERLKEFVGKTERVAQEQEAAEEQKEQKEPREVKISAETKVKGILKGKIKLSEKDLEDILWRFQVDLIQNDVAVETADEILEKLKDKLINTEIEKNRVHEFVMSTLRNVLLDTLTPEEDIDFLEVIRNSEKPVKILFLGVNGSGKTTTIAKVSRLLMDNNFKVVLAAGDTFRAGAIEQLNKHGDTLGVKVISHQKGADAAAVIFDAVEHAKAKNLDVVLADTAGRMQTNKNLMDEMKKICRVNDPDLKIFVADALTGNDAVDQANKFNERVGIDGIILTKMDANEKGGSALAITNETKKPILYIGTGQNYDHLKEFESSWFLDRLLEE